MNIPRFSAAFSITDEARQMMTRAYGSDVTTEVETQAKRIAEETLADRDDLTLTVERGDNMIHFPSLDLMPHGVVIAMSDGVETKHADLVHAVDTAEDQTNLSGLFDSLAEMISNQWFRLNPRIK